MSRTLIVLIVIMNLIPLVCWGYAAFVDLQNKNVAKHLLRGGMKTEGKLVEKDSYVVRGKHSATLKNIYGYVFAVDGKERVGVVVFAVGTKANNSMGLLVAGDKVSVSYDRNDPDINMPTNVAHYYLGVSPWRLGRLLEIMLITNGVIVLLCFIAHRRGNSFAWR